MEAAAPAAVEQQTCFVAGSRSVDTAVAACLVVPGARQVVLVADIDFAEVQRQDIVAAEEQYASRRLAVVVAAESSQSSVAENAGQGSAGALEQTGPWEAAATEEAVEVVDLVQMGPRPAVTRLASVAEAEEYAVA